MVLERAFFGLRQLYAYLFMDISLTSITPDEAIRIIRQHDLDVKIIISNNNDDCKDFSSYYDSEEHVIKIHVDDLYEEIVLHELGHAVEIKRPGSANYIYEHSETYNYRSFMAMEEEAWLFAEKYSSKEWGDSHRAHMRMCLDGYRKIHPSKYAHFN